MSIHIPFISSRHDTKIVSTVRGFLITRTRASKKEIRAPKQMHTNSISRGIVIIIQSSRNYNTITYYNPPLKSYAICFFYPFFFEPPLETVLATVLGTVFTGALVDALDSGLAGFLTADFDSTPAFFLGAFFFSS